MAYERDDKIVIEINHCLAYRKFAKYENHLKQEMNKSSSDILLPPTKSILTFVSSFISFIILSLWETSQTLFWAAFGLIDLDNFELSGIKEVTSNTV